MKTCSVCRISKEPIEFSRNSRTKDGYKFTCKTCDRASAAKYRNHPVRVANKRCGTCGIIKDADQFALSKSDSTGIRGDCRKCYAKKKLAYLRTDAGRAAIYTRNRTSGKYSAAKSLAIKRGYAWEITREEYYRITEAGRCVYDGEPLSPTGSGLDRKDNDIGYLVDNVVPCCTRCNTIKSNYWSYEEMLDIGTVLRALRNRRGQG